MRGLFLISCCFLLFSCDKRKDDFSGTKTISGRLEYVDIYSGDGKPLPAGNRKIYIARTPSDTVNYLYSTTTDADGYFVFRRLETPGTTYDLFFSDTLAGNKYFSFTGKVGAGEDKIRMTAYVDTRTRTGLFITVRDPHGDPVYGADVCIFSNAATAQADTCAGSVYQKDTDPAGRSIVYDMPAGTWYVRAGIYIDNVYHTRLETVSVAPAGITRSDIQLEAILSKKTGFEILVADIYGTPVHGASVCVFSNRTLFEADTCLGSIRTLTTDDYGKAADYGIRPGKYFLRAIAEYGNVRLKGADSIWVYQDSIHAAGTILVE